MELDALMDPMDMKVNELLEEVQVDYSPSFTKLVDDTVSAIRDALGKIPDDLQVTAELAPGFVRDIGADKVEFKFKKPQSLQIGGSYAIQGIAKPNVNVDLMLRMPKDCFLKTDYLDYRYFAKRCLYICVIKKYLKLSQLFSNVEWSALQNEARKPILVVYPAVKLAEVPGFSVRIIPTATSVFDSSKLNLKRNNVRSLCEEGIFQASPRYNSSILEDMFMEENVEFVNRTFREWKSLRDALILLKAWARQRSSLYMHDSLNGFLISIILSYLANHEKINKSMKAMQIFRVTLVFIATSKLWKRGLYFQALGENGIPKEERTQIVDLFPVVICNASAPFNIAFRVSENGFLELQEETALTLTCMEKCRDGGFEEYLMMKLDYPAKFDLCIRLNLRGHKEVYASGVCLDSECWRMYEEKVHEVLRHGLGDRAKMIRVTWRNTLLEYSIENGLSTLGAEPLFVGVSLNSVEKAFRVVDIGPHAENKEEALKFRTFWGEKAELRRFKDGTIAESTVWESEPWTRHLIVKRITEYVLSRHLSLSKDDIIPFMDQLDFALLYGVQDPISYSGTLTQAFEILSKRLRNIEDIPLKVSSVQPLNSAFRFTSASPPEPHPLIIENGKLPRKLKLVPSYIQPLEVMIQLEGSGNWPMDDVAIEKTKTAFLLQIGESLQNNYGMTCIATEEDVDILVSGFAFRLKILHEKGLSLLNREGNQAKKISSTDKALFIRGQHASMINGLLQRQPIYGPIVRLAKRWFASHLFSACLVEEAVELLVAYLFLKPFPFSAPCSRITGFLRFLRLLADYNWMFSPLIVDINNDLTQEDEKEINEKFFLSRRVYEENPQAVEPAMFIATVYDKASEAWTGSSPNSADLKRMAAYARSSANLLSKLVLQEQHDDYRWECLFRTPLNNYDAVILLHRDRLPYPQRLLFPSELHQGRHVAQGNASKAFHPFLQPLDLKGSLEEIKNQVMVDFDPLRCFLRDLERDFHDMFKMWYDSLGGDAIGLTWQKASSKKRGRQEEDEGIKAPVDLLKTVGELGKGLVRSVYFLKAPRLMN
ncbi:nucleolar protein 6 isoform X2 [Punica granatum]|uniref:Nucleolar protein 6 isoform X2 n=1 Tax=Punica granatum TaxID=22663 RepID=A0A6P8DQ58_PUNGR|nr:nucleolar protein 6 isoform X2 [Punica granatum]